MFGRKCTLCGGKVDSRGICEECGLDNNKSEKNYKINQASCDGKPLTHVHETNAHVQPQKAQKEQKAQKKQGEQKERMKRPEYEDNYSMPRQRISGREKAKAKKKSAAGRVVGIITMILTVAGILLAVAEDHGEEISSWAESKLGDGQGGAGKAEYTYDPYKYTARTLSGDGDHAEYELSTGHYIVGVHIPEGKYSARTQDDFDTIQTEDSENNIYLYEYEGKGDNYLGDLRLYDGAVVTVACKDTVTLITDNGQTASMQPEMPNPLTESVSIAGGETKTAGTDFAPGIYDIYVTGKSGMADVTVYGEGDEEIDTVSLYIGEGSSDGMGFKYMVLPEGAEVVRIDGGPLSLVPSEMIASEDYMEFYERLY